MPNKRTNVRRKVKKTRLIRYEQSNIPVHKKFGKTRLIHYKLTNEWSSVEKTAIVVYKLTYRSRETLRQCSCWATNRSHLTVNKEICLQHG